MKFEEFQRTRYRVFEDLSCIEPQQACYVYNGGYRILINLDAEPETYTLEIGDNSFCSENVEEVERKLFELANLSAR